MDAAAALGVRQLADASMMELPANSLGRMAPVVERRARHVLTEIGHVRETVAALAHVRHLKATSPDISHSSLMRSRRVFEDFNRGRSRLERPGYWQKQVANDLILARGLLQANWHPGWMQNRCGFAFSPHFPHPHNSTPPVRSRAAKKTAEDVKYAG